MKIVTKKDLIVNISKEWDEQYGDTDDRGQILISQVLKDEKPTTEGHIKKIIGNSSWTRNMCCECENDSEITIQLGEKEEEFDCGNATVNICPGCLKKALSLLYIHYMGIGVSFF